MTKLRINNEEDRLKVAAILIKNGYRVEQSKVARSSTTKTVDYVLIAEDVRDK